MLLDRIVLEAGEKVVKETRRHKFLLVLEMVALVFAAFVPPVVYIFIVDSGVLSFDLAPFLPYLGQLYAAWLLSLWIAAFSVWTHWYLDVLLITNDRLILVDQKGLWSRNVASFRLDRLQEVNVDISGILPTLLDFGTIHAETAGAAHVEFNMPGVPDPRNIKALIMTQVESARNIPYNQEQPV